MEQQKMLGGDAAKTASIMQELEDAITDCFKPFAGQEISGELVRDMCDKLYYGIGRTGLDVSVAGYEDTIDLHIVHPDGSDKFEANISLSLKGDLVTRDEFTLDADNRETT